MSLKFILCLRLFYYLSFYQTIFRLGFVQKHTHACTCTILITYTMYVPIWTAVLIKIDTVHLYLYEINLAEVHPVCCITEAVVLTRGAGSNCKMTCCMKTSRWVGRSFNWSILLKCVHWSSTTWESEDTQMRQVKIKKIKSKIKRTKLSLFTHISQIVLEILILGPDDAHGCVRALSPKHALLWREWVGGREEENKTISKH